MAIKVATDATFEQEVLHNDKPVVVDFWAAWCGPCRQLTPALEAEAKRRGEEVDLAKVDVDANPRLAQAFGVQGIPAVKAFRDGRVASEFTGAIPPAQVAAFFDALVPSEADRLASSEDEAELRRALELDPSQAEAGARLGRILLSRGDVEEAAELLGRRWTASDKVLDYVVGSQYRFRARRISSRGSSPSPSDKKERSDA